MGYFNRIKQLEITLDTIQKSKVYHEVEVIIVDDASDENHIISQLFIDKYTFMIKVFRIPPHIKKWRNPAIAYNLAFEHTSSDWVIIQNPEVCHVGDICSYLLNSDLSPETYYAISVYAVKNVENNKLIKNYLNNENPYEIIVPKLGKEIGACAHSVGGWYSHKDYRPKAYHFCTVIHKSKLDLIGGFSPSMSNGVDYDDDEFLERVKRVCSVKFVWDRDSKCFGIHLWHPKFSYQGDQNIINCCRQHNKNIFDITMKNPTIIKVDRKELLPSLEDLNIIVSSKN